MADRLNQQRQPVSGQVQYRRHWWGDSIEGTKLQLQSIGIGIGRAFPGEPGGPQRKMTVIDPRGLKAEVKLEKDGVYSASIRFQDMQCPNNQRFQHAPGVTVEWHRNRDEFLGTGAALLAAGIVKEHQLPGAPGMRKVCATVLPDGTVPAGHRNGPRHPLAFALGAMSIRRASSTTFRVLVYVSESEKQQRLQAESQWLRSMASRPKPAPLKVIPDAARHDQAFQRVLAQLMAVPPAKGGE